MGRPKKAVPKHVEPEEESQEVPEEQQALEATSPTRTTKSAPQESVSKAEAVRRAVAAGVETPAQGVDYVMKHFGIEMDNKTFSLNRSQQKSRQGKHVIGKPGRKPKATSQAVDGYLAPPASNGHFSGGMIGDLAAIKALVEKLGVEEVQAIAKLFG